MRGVLCSRNMDTGENASKGDGADNVKKWTPMAKHLKEEYGMIDKILLLRWWYNKEHDVKEC